MNDKAKNITEPTTPSVPFRSTPRELAPEAFQEAIERYPNDVFGALTFFAFAIGLGIEEPTAEDIAWAKKALERRDQKTFSQAADR